jgi:hypothetical protein
MSTVLPKTVAQWAILIDQPPLRLRAELRGRRIRLALFTVGLPTQYRSDQVLRRHPEDFTYRRLRRCSR